jgi:hypothetical protein
MADPDLVISTGYSRLSTTSEPISDKALNDSSGPARSHAVGSRHVTGGPTQSPDSPLAGTRRARPSSVAGRAEEAARRYLRLLAAYSSAGGSAEHAAVYLEERLRHAPGTLSAA